ncbi:P30 adhesin [Smittium culicis]|uniref:p30 adhesin n=1 Tax=Smittium culicis TaxID=133412 RepID=A0A1R1XSP3_9FUNG|nr:P30 adhesin [Smittium culicis]
MSNYYYNQHQPNHGNPVYGNQTCDESSDQIDGISTRAPGPSVYIPNKIAPSVNLQDEDPSISDPENRGTNQDYNQQNKPINYNNPQNHSYSQNYQNNASQNPNSGPEQHAPNNFNSYYNQGYQRPPPPSNNQFPPPQNIPGYSQGQNGPPQIYGSPGPNYNQGPGYSNTPPNYSYMQNPQNYNRPNPPPPSSINNEDSENPGENSSKKSNDLESQQPLNQAPLNQRSTYQGPPGSDFNQSNNSRNNSNYSQNFQASPNSGYGNFNQPQQGPGFNQGPPRPDFNIGQPGPGFNYGPPRPGFDQGPPRPGFEQGPPRPGFEQGPPRPGFEQGPPRPGFNQGPPRPGFEQGSPRPGFEQGPPRPGFNQGPPRPGFEQGPPRPGFEQGPPRPFSGPGQPGQNFNFGPPMPGNFVPSGPGYGPNNFRPPPSNVQSQNSNSRPSSIIDSKLDHDPKLGTPPVGLSQEMSDQSKKDSDKKKWMNLAAGSALGIGAATAIGAGIYAYKKKNKNSDSESDDEEEPEIENKKKTEAMTEQADYNNHNSNQGYNSQGLGNIHQQPMNQYQNYNPNYNQGYNPNYNQPQNFNPNYSPYPNYPPESNSINNHHKHHSNHINEYNDRSSSGSDGSSSGDSSSDDSNSDNYKKGKKGMKYKKGKNHGKSKYYDSDYEQHSDSSEEKGSDDDHRPPYSYDQNDVRHPNPNKSSVDSDTPYDYPAIYEDADDIVKYGTVVALKHIMTGRFLRSSEEFVSEAGSNQPLAYCESWNIEDDDSWQIMPANRDVPTPGLEVLYGDIIRLKHINTGRFLHSHYHFTCRESGQNEVTIFGGEDYSDENDHWRVERFGNCSRGEIWDRHEIIVLRHVVSGMTLHSHEVFIFDNIQSVTCFGPGEEDNDKWKAYFTTV